MNVEQYFNQITTESQKRFGSVVKALEVSPCGTLREEKHAGKCYFVHDYYVKGKRFKHSLTKDNEMLDCLIKKELYQKELESLKSIQKVMDYAQSNFIEFDVNKAIAEMMAKYPHLPEERILAALANQGIKTKRNVLDSGRDAIWANAEYERSTYRQEDLKQITTRGLKVRSKSEVMIAEKLYQHILPFRYEEVLRYGSVILVPDFIIRRADGKLFYWEHQGLTNDKTYIERQFKKNQLYASVDIVPWDNLIITYENETGLDLRRVDFEIQNRLLG